MSGTTPLDSDLRSFQDIKDIPKGSDIATVIMYYNELRQVLNFFTKNLSLQSNFNCQVLSVTVAASATQRVYHRLQFVPRYRIILRQDGNGLITDVSSAWNENYVTFQNNGTDPVTMTVGLFKE